MHRLALVLSALAFAAVAQPVQAQDEVVVYLVRHAERAEDGTDDPPLSRAGRARARLLAQMLRDGGLTHVHSTDYVRTRSTAAPTATALGLETLTYDPRDLQGVAADLRATPGRHLVLGHSNTTPDLVQALGGDPGEPIEEHEYDRLYLVVLSGDHVETLLLRFGNRFVR